MVDYRLITVSVLTAACLNGCFSGASLISHSGHAIHTSNSTVTSWKALNEQNIIMQKRDYSCGAASLATLMTYYFNDDVSEKKLLGYIEESFSQDEFEKVKKDGLSFLELEKISRSLGYQSASVRLKLPALKQLSGPVIVYLSNKHYRHFAVLRGVKEDLVFLADPSRGNVRLSISEFTQDWKGETFVLGKQGFGTPQQHPLAVLLSPGFRNEFELLRQPLLNRRPANRPKIN